MINCAVIMGRLTADPELRQTPSGVSVIRFTVAVDRRTKSAEDKVADFINIVAWRQTAEFVAKYFQKGSMIAVQGSIQTGSYEKDGARHYTFEILADNVSFCGSKTNNTTAMENATHGEEKPTADVDNDLPF
ncbi:MAG: single-stranded DNA-binding protein [Bacteroidales bacterium]|nr:single-stranded DNA-binding protein [Bacteroidales bacterium]